MTPQEAFNRCAEHLLNQGAKALSDNGHTCLYRAPGGLKCAVGALIPDEVYHPDMEGVGASHINSRFDLGWDYETAELLDTLQGIHDDDDVKDWPAALIDVANSYHLDSSVVYKHP